MEHQQRQTTQADKIQETFDIGRLAGAGLHPLHRMASGSLLGVPDSLLRPSDPADRPPRPPDQPRRPTAPRRPDVGHAGGAGGCRRRWFLRVVRAEQVTLLFFVFTSCDDSETDEPNKSDREAMQVFCHRYILKLFNF